MTTIGATSLLDHDHPDVSRYAAAAAESASSDREAAVALHYRVRDGINYEVFDTDLRDEGLLASGVLAAGRGFCLHKSVLYVAAARSLGLRARLMSGLVHNHLSTPELHQLVGGTTFLHWLAEVEIEGRWVRTTPVFNALMCRLYGIEPLEFDGISDAVHQPFDAATGEAMAFDSELRSYDDITGAEARRFVAEHHPDMVGPRLRVPARASCAVPAASAASLAGAER